MNSLIRASKTGQVGHIWERSAALDNEIAKINLKGRGRLKMPTKQWRNFSNVCEVRKPAPYQTFISVFGSGDRNDIDDDSLELSIEQVLTLLNGRVTTQVWRSAGNEKGFYFKTFYKRSKKMEDVFTGMYRSVLGREISETERKKLIKFTKTKYAKKEKRFRKELFEDLLWSMVNSDEFIHIY